MVEFPAMRSTLISCIRSLADTDYQWKVWIQRQCPREKYFGSFDLALESFYNDLSLDLFPLQDFIGGFLKDEHEVHALKVFMEILDEMPADWKKANNTLQEQTQIIKHPYWKTVTKAASELYTELTGGDSAEGMFRDLISGWIAGY